MHPTLLALLLGATVLLCGWYFHARFSSSSPSQTVTLDVTDVSASTSTKYDHPITPAYASFFQERLESSPGPIPAPGDELKSLKSSLEVWGRTHKVHGAHPLKLEGEGEWFSVLPHDGTPLECPPPCDVPTLRLPTYGSHDLVLVPTSRVEEWMDPELSLAVVQGHLSKGGWLVMAPTPSHPSHHTTSGNPPHYFFHTPTGLALLAERVGLHPVEMGLTAGASFGSLRSPSVLLGRKSTLDTHAHLPAFKAVGAGSVEGYTSSRPILLHKEEVYELWAKWVKGKWGWRPAGKGVWEELRRALGETTGDARGAAGFVPHAHAPHNNAAPLCSGFTIEAGYYLAFASIVETFPLLGVRKAHNPRLLAHLPRGCLCTLVSHLWGGGECGEYLGGRPGAALVAGEKTRGGGGAGGGPSSSSSSSSSSSLLGADAIVLSDFFEFVEDPILAVREVYDSLAPGGICFAVARMVGPLDPHTKGRVMLRTLSPMGLLSLFARLGFEVVAAQHWGTQEHTQALLHSEPPKFFSLPLGEDLGGGSYDTSPSQWEAVSMSWGVFRRPGGPSTSSDSSSISSSNSGRTYL